MVEKRCEVVNEFRAEYGQCLRRGKFLDDHLLVKNPQRDPPSPLPNCKSLQHLNDDRTRPVICRRVRKLLRWLSANFLYRGVGSKRTRILSMYLSMSRVTQLNLASTASGGRVSNTMP